jgi:hypothetical protein
MLGLVPGIHVFAALQLSKSWMAGTTPAMTFNFSRLPAEERSAATRLAP